MVMRSMWSVDFGARGELPMSFEILLRLNGAAVPVTVDEDALAAIAEAVTSRVSVPISGAVSPYGPVSTETTTKPPSVSSMRISSGVYSREWPGSVWPSDLVRV